MVLPPLCESREGDKGVSSCGLRGGMEHIRGKCIKYAFYKSCLKLTAKGPGDEAIFDRRDPGRMQMVAKGDAVRFQFA
jgi:hypothetical protein